MEYGEIERCNHCEGFHDGMCEKGLSYPSNSSCISCLKAAGLDPIADKDKKVICSVCKGKGKVWIGAEAFHYHEHQDTGIDLDSIEELVERLENKLDILIKISDNQSEDEIGDETHEEETKSKKKRK